LRAGNRIHRPGQRAPRREAFETESIAHFGLVYRTALRLTRNTSDAEDLTQETYVRALRAAGRFQLGTNLKAWLLTILRNADRNRRRDAARALVVVDNRAVAEADVRDLPEKTPEALLLRAVIDRDLQEALESLPRYLQEIVWLRDVEELSYAELAERLDIPLGTVMSRLSKARERLFACLTEQRGTLRAGR
jgi:RNA polymerase sigma-70 factor (ECF subfamily)